MNNLLSQETDKKRILIVDDVPTNIGVLSEALKDRYTVIAAKNGQQALERASSEKPPDLILLDIMMPGMDGYEVCRRLKKDSKTSEIPILFITAMDELRNKTEGFKLGAVDYITKPFEILEVKARVETHLALQLAKQKLKGQNLLLQKTVKKLTDIGASISSEKDVDLLLNTIVKETSKMLQAERASLFLYDDNSDELWIKNTSEGPDVDEIRFKADKGIAGYVATKRKTLNIEDAYSHELFNKEFDIKTGFRTKTILCVPMENQQEKLIGVVQVLNKKDNIFNAEDETILKMIASQAAISIDNSRLTNYLKKSYFSLQLEKEKILKEIGEKDVQASKGEIVGFRKYVIGEILGKGAFGEVYMAKEVSELGEWPVAIKVLKDASFKDPVQVEKTKEEGRLVRKYLNGHQNIVSTYFTDVFSGSPYIVMEYIDGMTLTDFQKAHKNLGKKIPIQVSIWLIKELCNALIHSWEVEKEDGFPLKMVHRDIKPSNILLTKEGVPKLSDFGVAIEGGESKSHKRSITGTPNFMSPEQAKGLLCDQRSDLFSLGLVFYFMLFGQSPYSSGDVKESLKKARNCEIPEPPFQENYPGEEFETMRSGVLSILKKVLAKDPEDRYESSTHMYEAVWVDAITSLKVSNISIKNYIRDFMKSLRQKKDGSGEEVGGESEITL